MIRELGVDRLHQVVGDAGDHLGQLDRLGDVVDEVDQHAEVDQQQRLGDRRGEVRDEVCAQAVDGDQAEHRVDERPDEDAQRHLVPDVADEVAHHAGPELLRGQRQRQDGDGEHHADDRDDGGRDGDQDLALGIGAPRADPDRERQVTVKRRDIDLERDEEQQDRDHDQDARDDPERRPQLLPAPARQLAPVLADARRLRRDGLLGADAAHRRLRIHGPIVHHDPHTERHDGKNRGRCCRLAPSSSSASSAANGYCPTSGLASSARTTSSRLPEHAAFTASRS